MQCHHSESNPSGLGTQPQVQVSPQNIEVHEGDTLRLYCRASGSPTPKLTWLKNGGQIPPQVRRPLLSMATLTWIDLTVYILLCYISVLHFKVCPVPMVFHHTVSVFMTVSAFWPFTFIFPSLLFVSSPPFFWSHPVLTFAQAIPSHGFHQFKSNSLDVLQRRIEELQVCPSVRCLSCPVS